MAVITIQRNWHHRSSAYIAHLISIGTMGIRVRFFWVYVPFLDIRVFL
jgi:hypothetical protein